MPFSKKASLIIIFPLLLLTNLTLLPMYWADIPEPQQKTTINFNAMKDALKNQKSTIKTQIKEVSNFIKESMTDKEKLIAGVATIGIGGGYLLSKVTKKAFAFAFYTGALYVVTSVGSNLLEGIEYKKLLPEIGGDLKNFINETTTTFNETTDKATQITNEINNMMNPSKPTK